MGEGENRNIFHLNVNIKVYHLRLFISFSMKIFANLKWFSLFRVEFDFTANCDLTETRANKMSIEPTPNVNLLIFN